MQLSNSGRQLSAFIVLVFLLLIFILYYFRWFKGTDSKTKYTGQWPPVINMCPDYLVYFNRGGQESCIDLVGVSQNQGLVAWTAQDSAENPPSAANKYFRYVYKPGMTQAQITQIGNAALALNLTWEGITNGYSLSFDSKAVIANCAASSQTASASK